MLTKSVSAAATAVVLLATPAIAGSRELSPELQNQRRKLWDIAEREKILADPRGLHRERLRQEGDAKIRDRGIYIHPDYHQLRRQIDVHSKQFYPNKKQQQKLETIKTEEERKTDEEVAFWERLLGDPHAGHMEFSITASPTKAPTPPVVQTPRPTQSPVAVPPPPTPPPSPPPVQVTPAPTVEPVVVTPPPTGAPVMATLPPVDAPTLPPVPVTLPPVPVTAAPTMAPADTPAPFPAPVATPVPTTTPILETPAPSPAPAETPAPTDPPVQTATPTMAPVVITPAPVVTTPAPVVTTPAPVATGTPTAVPVPATAAPTVGAECTITDLILSVALQGGAEFVDPESYQSKALDWLCNSDLTGLSDARIIQRYSLACIYYATYEVQTVFTDAIFGGAIFPWLDSTNWVTDANECTWTRIGCNDAGFVNTIDLFKNIITGEFPNEVVLLSDSLEIFDMGDNPVFTEGESFNQYLGQLSKLTDLRYDQTNFINTNGVPVEIGSLKGLQFYSCSQVLYSGALQAAAFQSDQVNLEFLEIEFNSYNSTVPASVGSLPSLARFYGRDSFLEGDLSWMQGMQSIFECWVDTNSGLGGQLPTFLGTLSTLGSFSVTECAFTGMIPTEMGLLGETIQRIFLYDNAFTGGVPTEFGNLQRMDFLQVENNALTIEMPSEVCVLTFGPLETLTADCVICPSTPCCTECF